MIYEETVVLRSPFDDVVADVRAAFGELGFGILTEIPIADEARALVGNALNALMS